MPTHGYRVAVRDVPGKRTLLNVPATDWALGADGKLLAILQSVPENPPAGNGGPDGDLERSYVAVRAECEALISAAGLPATFVRPWYVLGPGHRWPYLLLPLYAMAERFSGVRGTALRLGLVTLREMIAALVWAVENPAEGGRALDVEAIRKGAEAGTSGTAGTPGTTGKRHPSRP